MRRPKTGVDSSLQEFLSTITSSAERIGCGLRNLGNTCFLNSVLQCLYQIPELKAILTAFEHKNPNCGKGSKFCILCSLLSHMRHTAAAGKKQCISPRHLVANLSKISCNFKYGMQEDAHEFLVYVIDGLHETVRGKKDKTARSAVEEVFGGYLLNRIKCLSCKEVSLREETAMNFSLEISNLNSVEQALFNLCKTEILKNDNQYRCSGYALCSFSCNGLRDAEKSVVLGRPPPIISLQLKRFDMIGYRSGKISRPVNFPMVLNLEPFTDEDVKQTHNLLYNLFAIIVHAGRSPTSGHYYAFVKVAGRW